MDFPTHIIGLMSGTSADGVDAALLFTDGEAVAEAGASVFVPYEAALRAQILALMQGDGDAAKIAHALTEVHCQAVNLLLKKGNVSRETVSLIGFHGQTIRHAPMQGITVQIGDAAYLAKETGIPVVSDFRTNDVKNGGHGAPLVPLYHAALAASLPKPVMLVNIGGVANVTWIGGTESDSACVALYGTSREAAGISEAKGGKLPSNHNLLAFDCGPGNALMDDWVHHHTGARYDDTGKLAAQGEVDEAAVVRFLADPFFSQLPPKSLDRNHFKISGDWNAANGAATLTAMTAAAIAKACDAVPQRPRQLILCGGGRHNPTLVRMIAERSGCEVTNIDALGWDGDMIEAEAFAYLAARSVRGLPLSLPTTTGVKQPTSGGQLFVPPPHHHDDEDDNCTTPRSCCR